VAYFKPQGVPISSLEEVVLRVDEYEAFRLADMEGLPQTEAADEMNVSQPTFFRLLKAARSKVSEAIVKGKAIRIEGGNYVIRGRGGQRRGAPNECVCTSCGYRMPHPMGVRCRELNCPRCGSPMAGGTGAFQPKR
jgi:predicted DNA-binding protein (UPF0251 family)